MSPEKLTILGKRSIGVKARQYARVGFSLILMGAGMNAFYKFLQTDEQAKISYAEVECQGKDGLSTIVVDANANMWMIMNVSMETGRVSGPIGFEYQGLDFLASSQEEATYVCNRKLYGQNFFTVQKSED